MRSFLDLLKSDPKLAAAVAAILLAAAWQVVSGLALLVLDRWIPKTDQGWADWFAASPRLAALASVLKTAGYNLPGLVRSVRAYFAGPPPWLPKASTYPPPNQGGGVE